MILHYLILYQNPAGQMYDTYFWQQYSLTAPPMVSRILPVTADDPVIPGTERLPYKIHTKFAKKDVANALHLQRSSQETHMYSASQSERLTRLVGRSYGH